MSNLAYQGGKFKELIRPKIDTITEKLKKILDVLEYNSTNATLIFMIIAFISNLCTDSKIREYIATNPLSILEHFTSKITTMLHTKPVA